MLLQRYIPRWWQYVISYFIFIRIICLKVLGRLVTHDLLNVLFLYQSSFRNIFHANATTLLIRHIEAFPFPFGLRLIDTQVDSKPTSYVRSIYNLLEFVGKFHFNVKVPWQLRQVIVNNLLFKCDVHIHMLMFLFL